MSLHSEPSISGSSSNSGATLNSPLARRNQPTSGITHRRPRASPADQQILEPQATGERQPDRFERDFVEDDEVGSGEYGKAMKVRYKNGREVSDIGVAFCFCFCLASSFLLLLWYYSDSLIMHDCFIILYTHCTVSTVPKYMCT